jgi:hypothetical protein
MQNEATFVIEDGDVKYLLTDAAKELDFGATYQRASHVEPANCLLRAIFHRLREFGYERLAEFTRSWPILWRVNLAPIGGPILPTVYYDRAQAINAEIVAINKFWTGELNVD